MYYDVFKLDIWGRYVQLKRLLLYIRLTFGILNYCSALLNTLPQNKEENKALAPDECPDPELDLPFACHDGGMSDAKKEKKNLNFLVWEKSTNALNYVVRKSLLVATY